MMFVKSVAKLRQCTRYAEQVCASVVVLYHKLLIGDCQWELAASRGKTRREGTTGGRARISDCSHCEKLIKEFHAEIITSISG